MLKVFLTGDIHVGLAYNRYPEVKAKLVDSRFEALQRSVRLAEEEGCEFFAVAGDLFDTISVPQKTVKRVVEILESFNGTVLVLPGNHDFYTEDVPLWQHFANFSTGSNIVLLKELRPYTFSTNAGETLAVYPAFCQSKHAKENNIGWVEECLASVGADYHIGIAHGAIQGVTPDVNQEYFLMTEQELNKVPVDAWLIGHTHIPYPVLGAEERDAREIGKIFNAGTHQQTDLGNNAIGQCFVITLDGIKGAMSVSAHAVQTGLIRFVDATVNVGAQGGRGLKESLVDALAGHDSGSTIVRARIKGTLPQDEYACWRKTCDEVLSSCLAHECDGSELAEELTMERIGAEFSEMSAAYRLLSCLQDDPKAMQMAYELVQACTDKGNER